MNNKPLRGEILNDTEAQKKFDEFKSKDPFPSIDAALLNSADIHDYVIATGMISPYQSEKKLKSASYEIIFKETQIIYWDEDNKKQIYTFNDMQNNFTLKKNSIIYVNPTTKFRIPDYIALRFNLRVNLVHKGLLLGTGPLVDPGFEGNLLIPVHNLTANNYELCGDEGFIWIEFTKISRNAKWANNSALKQLGNYAIFPEDKKNLTAEKYFESANKNNPIQSSIPSEVKNAIDIALKTEKTVNRYKRIGWISLLAIGISLLAIIIAMILSLVPMVGLVRDSIEYVTTVREEMKKEVEQLKKELAEIKSTSQKQTDIQKTGRSENMESHSKSKQESSGSKDAKDK